MSTTSVLGGVVRRREDPALIQGRGRYTDDVKLAGTAHAAFVRSPFAHAKVLSVDASAAKAMEGVLAVYTAADVEHLGTLVAQVPVGKVRPLLNGDTVKHVGEAVAMVVATDPYLARDAADAVDADYDPLPAVVDLKESLSDASKVHDDLDSNTLVSWAGPFGMEPDALAEHRAQIQAAKSEPGAVTVSQEMLNQRLIPVPIEPRSVLADYQAGYDRFDIYSSTQIPSALAGAIGRYFGMGLNQVVVKAMEVGGGFGCKLNVYNDEVLTAFASKDLGCPVKWTETRREAANSTIQGRGWVATATLTGNRSGDIAGFELEGVADMGAYSQNFTVAIPFLGLFVGSGQYKFPTFWKMDCVATHTMTTDAYRGAGRPEAAYYLERIMDMYAREIGMDAAEVRRRNYIPASDFPGATSPMGFAMDTGDYEANLDAALEAAGWRSLLDERDAARAAGRHVGVGLATYVEVCGFGPSGLVDLGFSWAEYQMPSAFNGSGLVRVHPDGTATVSIGTGPSGQGHQTTWAQIVSDGLGLEVDKIRVIHGDTEEAPPSIGSFGSRSAAVDGSACYEATQKVRAKAAKIAAHLLEASADDIEFADGGAHVAGTPDSSVAWEDISRTAYQPHLLPEGVEGGLEAHAIFSPGNATWPFGTHIAMVEVDADTGDVTILRYIGMDDCGNVISPMIVDGQIHGGIAQGVGQAMFEDAAYDDDGNLLAGSLMDYILPTAADLPFFELNRTVTPTDVNPLGVKGIGEAGTIGSAQTVVNAVVDALQPLGVKHIDMPLRPRRVWQAIRDATA